MIQMKWRADSENSENSALDTIIVTHKIYEKKYFLIGLTLLLRIEQLNNLLVYTCTSWYRLNGGAHLNQNQGEPGFGSIFTISCLVYK